MNELQNFTNGFFNLDVKVEGEEILFSAEQVAKSLGFITKTNGTEYVRWNRVNEFLPQVAKVEKGSFISEPMVYKLAFKANNAVSEKFTDWLAVEVLPTIRKHGAYMTDKKAQDVLHGNGLADLLIQAGEQIKSLEFDKQQLQVELEEVREKTTYLDLILESPDDILTTQIAQDYGYSAVSFNRILHDLRIQRKVNKQWVLYSKYMGKGYIGSRTSDFVDSKGIARTSITTTWKQKGRKFLYEVLKKNGYFPLVEQDELVS